MKIGQLCLFRLSTPAEHPYGAGGRLALPGPARPDAVESAPELPPGGHAAVLNRFRRGNRRYPRPTMDPRPTPPPTPGESGVPAVRPSNPVARPDDVRAADDRFGPPPTPETPAHRWRRLTRTRKGAAGVAILAAALLLWPFAGWFWIPWLAGLVVLVLVALLRLDRLLRGWTWHLGGLAVVVGLMLVTSPWDWALAASLGVLLAGLVQLPWWRLAAVGAVLCLVAGVGWGVDRYRAAQEKVAQDARTSQQNRGQIGVARPNLVLQVVLSSVGRGDVGPFVTSSSQSRPGAVRGCRGSTRLPCGSARTCGTGRRRSGLHARGRAPSTDAGDVLTVDACRLTWPAGFGRLGVDCRGGAGPAAGAYLLGERVRAVPCWLRRFGGAFSVPPTW